MKINSKVIDIRIAFALIALILFLAFPQYFHAQGRPQNQLLVSQFAGNDVGTKLTNAQNACNTGYPCTLIIDNILAVYAAGSRPSICASCTWIDYTVDPPIYTPGLAAGSVTFNNVTTGTNNGGNTLTVGNTSSLVYTGTGDVHAKEADAITSSAWPLLAPNGTVAAPSYSFASNTGTGLYRNAASDLAVAIAGVKVADFLATGVTIQNQTGVGLTITAASGQTGLSVTGSTANPAVSVTGGGANAISVSVGAGTAGNAINLSMNAAATGTALAITGDANAPAVTVTSGGNVAAMQLTGAGTGNPVLQILPSNTQVGFNIQGQTVTTSNPLESLAQTWNAGGVTFTGFLSNITDTASASGSLLFDFQLGGNSVFQSSKVGVEVNASKNLTGNPDCGTTTVPYIAIDSSVTRYRFQPAFNATSGVEFCTDNGTDPILFENTGVTINDNSASFSWASHPGSNNQSLGLSWVSSGLLSVDTTARGNALGSVNLTGLTATGTVSGKAYSTATNCSSSASPAVCGSAAAGSVVIAAAATTVTVNTTAVTANSQIFLVPDDTLGTKLGVTCNSTLATLVGGLAVTARTAATSFQITSGATPAVNPLCISYYIVN